MDIKSEIVRLSEKEKYDFYDLCSIVRILRSDLGCPWDREQTHKSVRMALIEETYEAAEAIDNDDPHLMREELGDVMLQILFHAEMERETGRFDIGDVVNDISAKMVKRHPHVFFNEIAENSDKVIENWEKIKNKEKKRESATSRLTAVPKTYPALMRAQSVSSRAAKVKFDFPSAEEAKDKILEELKEIESADGKDMIFEESGDLLFSVVNYLRKMGVNSEEALIHATDKFISRFEKMEKSIEEKGKKVEMCTLKELEKTWNFIKIDKK